MGGLISLERFLEVSQHPFCLCTLAESSSLPSRFFQSAEIPTLPASLLLCMSLDASSALSGPLPWAVRL